MITALILVISGCGNPPWVERFAARQAMSAALAKGADKKAPAEFAAAKEIMDKANLQVSEWKHTEAIQTFIKATIAFERATWIVQTASERQVIMDQTNKKLVSLETNFKKLEVEAAKKEAVMKAKYETDAKAFMATIKTAKDGVIKDTIGVKATIAAELQPIYEKWNVAFRPLIPLKKS